MEDGSSDFLPQPEKTSAVRMREQRNFSHAFLCTDFHLVFDSMDYAPEVNSHQSDGKFEVEPLAAKWVMENARIISRRPSNVNLAFELFNDVLPL